eukprot:104608-Amphidinium_carterae.3
MLGRSPSYFGHIKPVTTALTNYITSPIRHLRPFCITRPQRPNSTATCQTPGPDVLNEANSI